MNNLAEQMNLFSEKVAFEHEGSKNSLTERDGLMTDINDYDYVIVSYSGGKDSLAILLHLLEMGVDRASHVAIT